MKQSIIICEGETDAIIIQYYMRKALGWEDVKDSSRQNRVLRSKGYRARLLEKTGKELTIASAGGVGKIPETLANVFTRMKKSPPDMSEAYDDIVILTDRDDEDSEKNMSDAILRKAAEFGVQLDALTDGKQWHTGSVTSDLGIEKTFRMLLLMIPDDENGAMESFLLKAISAESDYDRKIQKGNAFVDSADPEKRYLTKRRYITKAKYDVYFSIRTPLEQFGERQHLLLHCPWEKYSTIREEFKLLSGI